MSGSIYMMHLILLLLQHTATHCNTLQRTATHCSALQHTATHCNTLQHTATHCNTLQHTATHCNTLQHASPDRDTRCERSGPSLQYLLQPSQCYIGTTRRHLQDRTGSCRNIRGIIRKSTSTKMGLVSKRDLVI